MKLKHIDLYIKLNQMEKATVLLREVEEEDERLDNPKRGTQHMENHEPTMNTWNARRMPTQLPSIFLSNNNLFMHLSNSYPAC
jgi:hypothetical protein